MSESESPSPERQEAEKAFHRFLEQARKGEVDGKEFAAELDEDIRPIFEQLLRDYESLRGMLGEQPLGITPGRMIGEFRLIRSLGQGGMGMVWEAEQTSLGRLVALKLLFPHLGLVPRTLERFRREATTGGKLAHPGVVRVIATGESDGIHFIAQELVGGGYSLADSINQLRDRHNLPPRYYQTVASTFSKITVAMEAAHDCGIIHRDIKPGNILLTETGTPRVADFGLAKLQESVGISKTGELAGTPFFMSPEQASRGHKTVGFHSDIFSLGASLYESLTLERPFKGSDSDEVLEKIRIEDPVPPHKLRKSIPVELSAICMKALEKELVNRYDSMESFGNDLRAFMLGQKVVASPARLGVRVWRHIKRRPKRSIATVAVLTSITSVVITTRLMQLAETNRLEAEESTLQSQASLGDVAVLIEQLLKPNLDSREEVSVSGRLELAESTYPLAKKDESIPPDVKGRLLQACARAFEESGNLVSAIAALNDAQSVYETHWGTQSDGALLIRIAIGSVMVKQGKYQDATIQLEQTYKDCVMHLPIDSTTLWVAANTLGEHYSVIGKSEEGRELMEASVRHLRKEGAPANLAWLKALSNLASYHNHSSRYQEAVSGFREVVKGDLELRGDKDPITLINISNLVNSLANAGQGAEAIELADLYLSVAKSTYGEKDRLHLSLLSNKTIALSAENRPEEAYLIASNIMSIRIGKYGGKHPKTLSSLALCGRFAGETGDYSHGIKLLRSALIGAKEIKGERSSSALLYGMRLGELLLAYGKTEEAKLAMQESLSGYIEVHGESHPNVAILQQRLGALTQD